MKMIHKPNGAAAADSSRRGSALVLSLIAVMVVAALSATYLQLSLSTSKRQMHSADTKRALYLAEAGLAEAYVGLAMGKTGNVGTEAEPAAYGQGLLWVEATVLPDERIELEATGMAGRGRATLGLVVERIEQSAASLGIYGGQAVLVQSGSLIDSYDSDKGDYASQVDGPTNFAALLGSGSDISITGGRTGSELRGDAVYGVGASLATDVNASVTGAGVERSTTPALPPVRLPETPRTGRLAADTIEPKVLAPGDHGFQDVVVGTDSTLIVVGPATLAAQTISLASGAVLELDVTGGPIDIFVTDGLVANSGSSIAQTSTDPTRTTLQAAPVEGPADLVLHADMDFYGTIYAPQSAVLLDSSVQVFGAVVADELTLNANARLHVDRAVMRYANDSLPRLSSWRVVDIADTVASRGSDPFALLGLDQDALAPPAQAHQNQWLEVDYVDGSGADRTYTGWENAFDWTDVEAIETIARDGQDLTGVRPGTAADGADDDDGDNVAPAGTPTDWIQDPSHESADLKDWLLDAAPLTTAEAIVAIGRDPRMDAPDLEAVLRACYPLQDSALAELASTAPLGSGTVMQILDDHYPLSAFVLREVAASDLDSPHIREVLVRNSPLRVAVLDTLAARTTPLDAGDMLLITLAQ